MERDEKLPTFSAEDIPLRVAVAAHEGTSFVPERRGEQRRAEYVAHLEAVRDEMAPLATTDEARTVLVEELARYRAGYQRRYLAQLHAASRTLSPMITGGSNFPVRRNEKANRAARKRWEDTTEWSDRARRSIRSKLNQLAGRGPISSDRADALDLLRGKLAGLEACRSMMVAANKIVRAKKSEADKVSALEALGMSEAEARQVLAPDVLGRSGFHGFELTNTGAEIRRLRARIDGLESARKQHGTEATFEGGRIVSDVAENRVRIFFDDKPAPELRGKLKARGFRWAPSVGAWQRQRTASAEQAAREIVGEA